MGNLNGKCFKEAKVMDFHPTIKNEIIYEKKLDLIPGHVYGKNDFIKYIDKLVDGYFKTAEDLKFYENFIEQHIFTWYISEFHKKTARKIILFNNRDIVIKWHPNKEQSTGTLYKNSPSSTCVLLSSDEAIKTIKEIYYYPCIKNNFLYKKLFLNTKKSISYYEPICGGLKQITQYQDTTKLHSSEVYSDKLIKRFRNGYMESIETPHYDKYYRFMYINQDNKNYHLKEVLLKELTPLPKDLNNIILQYNDDIELSVDNFKAVYHPYDNKLKYRNYFFKNNEEYGYTYYPDDKSITYFHRRYDDDYDIDDDDIDDDDGNDDFQYLPEEYWLRSFFDKQYYIEFRDDMFIQNMNYIKYYTDDTYTNLNYIEYFEKGEPAQLQKYIDNELIHSYEYIHNYEYELRFLIVDGTKAYFIDNIHNNESYQYDELEDRNVGFLTDPEKIIKNINKYYIMDYDNKLNKLYVNDKLYAIGYFDSTPESHFATNYTKVVFFKDNKVIAMKKNIQNGLFDSRFDIKRLFDIDSHNFCHNVKCYYDNKYDENYYTYKYNQHTCHYEKKYYYVYSDLARCHPLISQQYYSKKNKLMMYYDINNKDTIKYDNSLTQICIKNPKTNKLKVVNVNLNISIISLYNLIRHLFEISSSKLNMNLYYNGTLLKYMISDQLMTQLKDYDIHSLSTIYMNVTSTVNKNFYDGPTDL